MNVRTCRIDITQFKVWMNYIEYILLYKYQICMNEKPNISKLSFHFKNWSQKTMFSILTCLKSIPFLDMPILETYTVKSRIQSSLIRILTWLESCLKCWILNRVADCIWEFTVIPTINFPIFFLKNTWK